MRQHRHGCEPVSTSQLLKRDDSQAVCSARHRPCFACSSAAKTNDHFARVLNRFLVGICSMMNEAISVLQVTYNKVVLCYSMY